MHQKDETIKDAARLNCRQYNWKQMGKTVKSVTQFLDCFAPVFTL